MLPPGPIDSSSKGAMGGAYPLASGRPAQTGPTTPSTHSELLLFYASTYQEAPTTHTAIYAIRKIKFLQLLNLYF
jgi:hypothetical protein